MTKPPTKVRSIRLPETLWAKLKAEAEAAGVSLNAHIAGLCDQPRARLDVPVISTRGASAKGAPPLAARPAMHVSVPLAGTFERRPIPKGSKR